MITKLTNTFIGSAAGLLAAFATALVLGNIATLNLVSPHEPLLSISTNILFWILGALALAIALGINFIRSPRFKLVLILWFAANGVIYRLGLQSQGIHTVSGFVGGLAHAFDLSPFGVVFLLTLLFCYLFIGSATLLLWNSLARPDKDSVKIACAHCGGHIAFSTSNLGQKIPCPHCKKEIILKEPAEARPSSTG